jgi:hypothetical protein
MMTRALAVGIALLSLGAVQSRAADQWQATSQSMTDLLGEGYRLVSVAAPTPQLRVFFLSNAASVAKCSEEQVLKNPPPAPRPDEKGVPKFDPREFVPQLETKIECSKLTKAKP